ncbi:MAG: amino acid ABC transporter substrate-binding protein [SAR324 cluster bacterium]|uniref:Amino acid ABC transporter substrate-binding protein n=1 Tax=SAR324 cluster bacterium TaxID=2024889 RepID=A0A2A4T6V4_9DELT|nr:MAG: amino acid ABC transporter substrate-binding protein [SAR324 cluster bacterium]
MKTRKLATVFFSLFWIISVTSTVLASTLEDIMQRGVLRVAAQTQGPPFSFVNGKGERTGSAVELARLMAKEMGVKIKFLNYDWDGLIPALLSGKADILAADMTPTLARAMKIAFTTPFMYTGNVAFAKKDSPYRTLADLKAAKNLTVATLLGSAGTKVAAETFPNAKQKVYKGGGPFLIDAVLKGRTDFAVNDSSAVYAQVSNFPPNSIKIIPERIDKSPLAYAVRYDSPALLSWMDLFFLHIKLDGRLDANLDYWVNSLDWKNDHD